jgi:integrase
LRETDKTTLTWEQLRDALASLALRDRILLELDMSNALRPSELVALRWTCVKYEESRMKVVETVYKGAIRPWGKKQEKPGLGAPAERARGRLVALEAGVS